MLVRSGLVRVTFGSGLRTDSCPATELGLGYSTHWGLEQRRGKNAHARRSCHEDDTRQQRALSINHHGNHTLVAQHKLKQMLRHDERKFMFQMRTKPRPVPGFARFQDITFKRETAQHGEFPCGNPVRKFPQCGTSHKAASGSACQPAQSTNPQSSENASQRGEKRLRRNYPQPYPNPENSSSKCNALLVVTGIQHMPDSFQSPYRRLARPHIIKHKISVFNTGSSTLISVAWLSGL